jgi:hypothetical protein
VDIYPHIRSSKETFWSTSPFTKGFDADWSSTSLPFDVLCRHLISESAICNLSCMSKWCQALFVLIIGFVSPSAPCKKGKSKTKLCHNTQARLRSCAQPCRQNLCVVCVCVCVGGGGGNQQPSGLEETCAELHVGNARSNSCSMTEL